jgi:hypothetical protein
MRKTAQAWADLTGKAVVCEITGRHVYYNLTDLVLNRFVAEITELVEPLDSISSDGDVIATPNGDMWPVTRPLEYWVRWLQLPVTAELESDGEIQYYVYRGNTQTCITNLVERAKC